MIRVSRIHPELVETIPERIEEGTLYISTRYRTAIHKCCCGCGNEIVTPLGPTDWKLTMEGEKATLHPSIGNWELPCRSHYWIIRNMVRSAPAWSREQIIAGRTAERAVKDEYFGESRLASPPLARSFASLWDFIARLFGK